MKTTHIILILALIATRPLPAAGTTKLKAMFLPLTQRSRYGSAVEADITLDWQGQRVLEGHLEMEAAAGNDRLASYRTGEIAVAPGEQTFRVCLPPAAGAGYQSDLDVRVRFQAGDASHDLGTFPVLMGTAHSRTFVVALCQNAFGARSVFRDVTHALRFTQFQPKSDKADVHALVSTSVRRRPEDLPAHALGYCAFDLVVVPPEELNALRQRQLTALLQWIRAGGSLCVFPSEGQPKPQVAEFLDAIRETAAPADAAEAPRVGLFYCGLGRAAVVQGEPPRGAALSGAVWHSAAAFLWKVRTAQRGAIRSTGVWRTDLQDAAELEMEMGMVMDGTMFGSGQTADTPIKEPPFLIRPTPLQTIPSLVQNMIPASVTIMPFGVVVAILVLFAAAIGPADYFLLGLLKRRRLTWVLFPVTSVLFTLFTIGLSRHYMGSHDSHNAVSFIDFDGRNTVVRQNRLEVIFTAAERDVKTELQDAMFTPMSTHDFAQQYGSYRYRGYAAMHGTDADTTTSYEGRVPARYAVRQEVRQWSPQLNRILSITQESDTEPPKWDSLTVDELRAGKGMDEAVAELLGKRSRQSCVLLFHGNEVTRLHGKLASLESHVAWHGRYHYSYKQERQQVTQFEHFVRDCCVRPCIGFHSIVSQTAPSAAPRLEDLPLLDTSNPDEWLVVVITRDDDDFNVYRKMYREPSP